MSSVLVVVLAVAFNRDHTHKGNFKYASRHNLYAGAVKQGLQNLPRRGTWGAAREGEKGTGDGVSKLLCLIGSCE